MATDRDNKAGSVRDEAHEAARLLHAHEPHAELAAHVLVNHGFEHESSPGGPGMVDADHVYGKPGHTVMLDSKGGWNHVADNDESEGTMGGDHHSLADHLKTLTAAPATETGGARDEVRKAMAENKGKKMSDTKAKKTT